MVYDKTKGVFCTNTSVIDWRKYCLKKDGDKMIYVRYNDKLALSHVKLLISLLAKKDRKKYKEYL